MEIPDRIKSQEGRVALVDGIPFQMPVVCAPSPALIAAFTIDASRAARLLPGRELFPLRLWNDRGVLMIVVIDYQRTTIGKYIEFSVGVACTHGSRPAPPLLPGLLMTMFETGQYVFDLPVSSEISVKGGKGIWGMPKHRANLDFVVDERTASSAYELEGQPALSIDIDRPGGPQMPLNTKAVNYCAFRGMLMKSTIYFTGHTSLGLLDKASARLRVGTHPRVQPLRELDISPEPLMTAFIPDVTGTLDDHIEAWFLDYDRLPSAAPEGLESVANLGLSQEWLAPPHR